MCSFYAHRSQKRKKIQLSHQYLFTLSGSESVKAVRRTLMKLTPDGHQFAFRETPVNRIPLWRWDKSCSGLLGFVLRLHSFLWRSRFRDTLLMPGCSQFHQHYTRAFFVRIFCQSKNVTRNITREKLPNRRSYKKFILIMLTKLTPVVNFINILLSNILLKKMSKPNCN